MSKISHQFLWRWICMRILALAIGTIVIIAALMWLRFALENMWIMQRMSPALKQEFQILLHNPTLNPARFHQIMDDRWGLQYSVPSIASPDWIALGVMIVVMIPVITLVGLRIARPLSAQFGSLVLAAGAVARGEFATRAAQIKNAPTELVRFTADFNAMTAQLERYDRELQASHVAMAHELRSPLTAAIGRMQGMLDGVFQPEPEQLQMVMKQLQHLSRLTDELHLLSLADAGQLVLHHESLDITELLHERANWLTPQAEALGMAIVIREQAPCMITGDAFRLAQVFTIVMENALRYAAEGRRLSVWLESQGDRQSICFKDRGPGVAEDFLPSLFDRFTRGDSSRARHSGGSGLGLSIARAICLAHGGDVVATLPDDGGLLITVMLPTDQDKNAQ